MNEHAEVEIVRSFDPLTLPAVATVMIAARHMRSRNASACLVVERDVKLVGIFTERDGISRVLAEGKDPARTPLAEVMTDNPSTVGPESTAEEIVRLMRDMRVRHLPIVHEGKVVGMVSRGRFYDTDANHAATAPQGSVPQEATALIASLNAELAPVA